MSTKNTDSAKRLPARSFEDLIVWQKAHEAVLLVYKLTKEFPSDEKFGLTSQFRRASISIAANISEGFAKKSGLEKIRFLNISQGSLEECKYFVILSRDLGYGSDKVLDELFIEIGKMLNGYISKLKDDANS
jgi:four helix bundle protein